ncbi:MAG: O-antigen ligase family protein [Flavobacteriales bacterium]|nr:O-antigen ligase family protein [Flavobacteriales bacterium]
MKTNALSFRLKSILFLAWFLTLPFGSNLLGISLGSFTIYPNLILTLALIPLGFSSFKNWNKLEISILGFLFLWLLFAIFQGQKSSFLKEEIFDIRSLIMQFLIAFVLVTSFHSLGKNNFLKHTITGLRCFLFILLSAGIVEFLTGIHFAGTKTHEFLELSVGNNFYAPMFIYDNQNDYIAYLFFTYLMLYLFDEKLRQNSYLQLLFSLIIFVFAVFADSNFAKLLSAGMIVLQLGILFYQQIQKRKILDFLPYVVAIVLLVITIFTNTLFFGPKYENSANYRLNGVQIVNQKNGKLEVISAKEKLSKSEQNQVIQYLDSVNTKSPENAPNLRKNLILNGIDFIKSAPIFGLGPGGFALKIKRNEHQHFIHTHTSPHNFPIEIISQFGVFGWFYFGLIGFIAIQFFKLRKIISNRFKIALITLFVSLPFLWMMPSAYLYLSIHWLFLPLLLIQLLLIQEKSILNEHEQ